MYLWESDIQKSIVFKPIEIRGKKGRKKMKKSNTAIYIQNMDADNFEKICNEKGLEFIYVELPPHGRLIDADVVARDLQDMSEDIEKSFPYLDKNDALLIERGIQFARQYVLNLAPTIIEAEDEDG